MTDTYEHLENLPDEDEVAIQNTVDDGAVGVTANSRAIVDSEPDRSREVMSMAHERKQLLDAATQLAQVLAVSGKSVSRVMQVGSQYIARTVMVPPGATAEKLLSENYERSVAKLWIPIDTMLALSQYQITGTFALPGDIPASSVILQGAVASTAMNVLELRSVQELWALPLTAALTPVPVCILEEFLS